MKPVAVLLSALTVAAIVVTFGFGYAGVFTPGPDDYDDAAFLTFIAALVLGGGATLAWAAAVGDL